MRVRRILDYSNKNPWLYAVYVVLVGLPLVLIITFCCSGSSDKPGCLQKFMKARSDCFKIRIKMVFQVYDFSRMEWVEGPELPMAMQGHCKVREAPL